MGETCVKRMPSLRKCATTSAMYVAYAGIWASGSVPPQDAPFEVIAGGAELTNAVSTGTFACAAFCRKYVPAGSALQLYTPVETKNVGGARLEDMSRYSQRVARSRELHI